MKQKQTFKKFGLIIRNSLIKILVILSLLSVVFSVAINLSAFANSSVLYRLNDKLSSSFEVNDSQKQPIPNAMPNTKIQTFDGPNTSISLNLSTVSTGQAPFDATDGFGNDTNASNNIIRNNDELTIRANIGVNSSAGVETVNNLTLKIPQIPNAKILLPIDCLSGSNANSSPANCLLGNVNSGSSINISFKIVFNSSTINGSNQNVSASLTSDDSNVSSNILNYITSSIPKYDFINGFSPATATNYNGQNGEPGFFVEQRVVLSKIGSDIGLEYPRRNFSYTTDISNLGPNARMVSWGPLTGIYCNDSSKACTQVNPGDNIQVNYTGTGALFDTNPELKLYIWMPQSDVTDSPYNGSRTLTTTVQDFVNFEGVPLAGNSNGSLNNGNGTEPIPNNTASKSVFIDSGTRGSFFKRFNTSTYVRGEVTTAQLNMSSTNSFVNLKNVVACDKLDTRYFNLSGIPNGVSQNGLTYSFEYGTGGYTDENDRATKKCENGDSPSGWFSSPNLVPGGIDAVTKVRVFVNGEINQSNVSINIPITINTYINNDINQGLVPVDEPIYNYGSFKYDNSPNNDWISYPSYFALRGSMVVKELKVSSNVQTTDQFNFISKNVFAEGDTVDVVNYVQIQAGTIPTNKQNITYRLVIPSELEFLENLDPSVPIISQTILPTGETEIIFDVSNLYVPSSFNSKNWKVRTRVKLGISTPSNKSVSGAVYDQQSLIVASNWNISFPANTIEGLNISTATLNPTIYSNQNFTNELSYTNLQNNSLNNVRLIAIKPYNGDATGSQFNGTVNLDSITAPNFDLVEYTSSPISTISNNPSNPTNNSGGSTIWCTALNGQNGCPSQIQEVNAVRLTRNVLSAGSGSASLGKPTLTYSTSNNQNDDRYNSNFAANSTEIPTVQSSIIRTDVTQPDLEVTKTVNIANPALYTNVMFSIVVENKGSGDETGVSVTDLLPEGLELIGVPSGGQYTPADGTWVVGNIPAGGSVTLTIEAKVNTIGTKTNKAEVLTQDHDDLDSTPGNSNILNEDDNASVDVTPQYSDLSVSMVVDNSTPGVGDQITYTITVSNDGNTNEPNFTLTNLIPSGTSFVSASGNYDPNSNSWTDTDLTPNTSRNYTLTVQIVSTDNPITNTAQITSQTNPDPDSTPNNNLGTEDDQATLQIQALNTSSSSSSSSSTVLDSSSSNLSSSLLSSSSLSSSSNIQTSSSITISSSSIESSSISSLASIVLSSTSSVTDSSSTTTSSSSSISSINSSTSSSSSSILNSASSSDNISSSTNSSSATINSSSSSSLAIISNPGNGLNNNNIFQRILEIFLPNKVQSPIGNKNESFTDTKATSSSNNYQIINNAQTSQSTVSTKQDIQDLRAEGKKTIRTGGFSGKSLLSIVAIVLTITIVGLNRNRGSRIKK